MNLKNNIKQKIAYITRLPPIQIRLERIYKQDKGNIDIPLILDNMNDWKRVNDGVMESTVQIHTGIFSHNVTFVEVYFTKPDDDSVYECKTTIWDNKTGETVSRTEEMGGPRKGNWMDYKVYAESNWDIRDFRLIREYQKIA